MNRQTVPLQRIGKRCQQLPILLGFFFFAFWHQPATWAHSPNDSEENSFPTKIRQAALIVYGQVVDIQYRNSIPTRIQPKGVPHTFVTYALKDVLRGEAPDKQITLRIPGGADGEGGIYMETTAPVFALGQTDVLFVKGGEIDDCQLVDCVEGRFRVVDNQIYNGWGVPVVKASRTLRMGGKPRFDLNVMELPRPPFQALLQRAELKEFLANYMKENGLDLRKLQAKYEAEAPKVTTVNLGYQARANNRKDVFDGEKAKRMERYGKPLTMEVFFDSIRKFSKRFGPPSTKVVMADAETKFAVPDPRAMEFKPAEPTIVDVSEEERLDRGRRLQ